MQFVKVRNSQRKTESGSMLLETLIAGLVLAIGMLAITALFAVAIGNNGRSKIDSTATLLSQDVLEQITAVLAGGGPGSIKDCTPPSGKVWIIATSSGDPSAGGAGARLVSGKVDFSEANPPNGYHMDYVICPAGIANNNGTATVYDVRWNIQAVSANNTFLVTVAAKPKNGLPTRFAFALPVTLRSYVGR